MDKTDWQGVSGNGSLRIMGIKGKNERTKRTLLNGCRGPWHDILEAAHGGWGIDSLRSKEIVLIEIAVFL